MNKLFPLTALAIACVSSPLVSANDKLEEIVVISSRVPTPLRQIGTSVSVISANEIQQRGFNSLMDVLRSQPAVAVSNTGGAGKTSSLRIRGEEGFRTKIYLDKIDISDTSGTQTGPRIEHLLSSGIQRVEILRGPQGLMYGADAGGIVDITTASSQDGLSGEFSAEGGRYGTQQVAAYLGGGNDSVDFNLSASDFETDGFNARSDDTVLRDDDGYENTTFHGRVGWNVSEDFRLSLTARDVDAENAYDNCFDPVTFDRADDCRDDFSQSAWRAAAQYEAGAFTHELSYMGNETDRDYIDVGVTTYSAHGELETLSYIGSFTADDSLRLVYGVDLEESSVEDGADDPKRTQDGYYAEYQGNFNDNLYLTAGLRYDDNEDFGDHTSYRVSGAYLFSLNSGELKLKGTYGTGFRAPSLSEIALNNGPWAYPPASDTVLKEEESDGYDIGLSWYGKTGLYLEAVYFDQTVSDEIFYDLVDFSGYLQGDGETNSTGVELIGEVSLISSLTLSGNYTYNDTEDSSGATRIRRPEHLINLGADWRGLDDKLVLGLNVRGSYDIEGIVDGARVALDDYEVIDINASFEILHGLQIYGRVENLLDEDYEEVPNYNTSGTAAYAGVRYSF
ncbi:MAG: TonB-dependent receptor [Halioglobus sp.]